MINNLPQSLSVLFILIVIATIVWFYIASKSKTFILIAVGWAIIQSIIGYQGIYQSTSNMPPRIMLFGIFPALVLILLVFVTSKGKAFINNVNLKPLTYLHSIRIPIEWFLFLLLQHGVLSIYLTFKGTNFDIFSGVSAPIIAYFAFRYVKTDYLLLIIWNVISLLLLLNVVVTAILAMPSPFQRISLEQTEMAILYFPFCLLPTVVVPIVLFAHLIAIKNSSKNLE